MHRVTLTLDLGTWDAVDPDSFFSAAIRNSTTALGGKFLRHISLFWAQVSDRFFASHSGRLEVVQALRAFLRVAHPPPTPSLNAPLLDRHIDALTIRIPSTASRDSKTPRPVPGAAAWLLAALVSTLDNLSERLHHATCTYLPHTVGGYIKLEGYALPIWLLEGAALAAAASIGRRHGSHVEGEGSHVGARVVAGLICVGTAGIGAFAAHHWARATLLQLQLSAAAVAVATIVRIGQRAYS